MPGEQLLLINPRRRKRRHVARRRRHVARRRRHVARRAAPRRRHRRHVARRMHANPRHRRRVHRRYHRNPSMGGMGSMLVPVGIGAAGAVGIDILWGYLTPYLPAAITGNAMFNIFAKAGVAVAGGWAAGKALGRTKGRYVMAGALTVYGYELLESLVKQFAPTLPFAGMGAYMPHRMAGVSYNPSPYLLPSASPVTPAGLGAYMFQDQPVGGGGMGMF
jgi:hypothetical protein